MEKDGQRYFIKFAGAPTEQYDGDTADAIARLKTTLPIYNELKHENLIDLIEAQEIGCGFAMVFKWVDGDCMGRMYPAAHYRFMQLPINARLAVFNDILSFFDAVFLKIMLPLIFMMAVFCMTLRTAKQRSTI